MDILTHLHGEAAQALRHRHCPALPSTNTALCELARAGEAEGLVLTAGSQSAGRGRLGRQFLSPAGGLYLSLLLRPKLTPDDTLLLTAAACTAVCRGIRSATGLESGIKWVNDVYLGGKKVCGILCEGQLGRDGDFDFAVLGIGLNLSTVPEGAADIAGSLGCGSEAAGPLAAAILDELWPLYRALPERAFLEEYRARSVVLGKTVQVLSPAGAYEALAEEIDSRGNLIVRKPDGSARVLDSGEVSLRL